MSELEDEVRGATPQGAPPSRRRPELPPAPPARPQTSGLRLWLWPFFFGLLLGTSCVTCGHLPGREQREFAGESAHRVAVLELEGPIMDTSESVRTLAGFARQKDIDAVVVRINSPGGAVAPSQELFDAMRAASAKKPIVASMGSVAASGGFWAAMGADYVFAAPGSITGSIGVISQAPDLRELARFLKVDVHTFKSGPYKDLGNPLREMTEGDRAIFQGLVDDIFEQFVTMIAQRRGLEREQVLKVADGRVMSGRAAHEAKLVDALGGLREAAVKAAELADEKKRAAGDKVPEGPVDPSLIYPRRRDALLSLLAEDVGSSLMKGLLGGFDAGLEAAARRVEGEVRAPW